MASLKDYKRFKNSIIGINIKKKGKKEYLVFTINPQELITKSKKQRGGEIFSILAPYVISIGVAATAKLIKDMYNVVKDEKTTTKEYFKQKYGNITKFVKNFIGSPEILLSVVATPLLYKKIIGNIPNKELSNYLLKKTTYYAEQLPRRLDYRFDEKYSISYLKNQKRSFN